MDKDCLCKRNLRTGRGLMRVYLTTCFFFHGKEGRSSIRDPVLQKDIEIGSKKNFMKWGVKRGVGARAQKTLGF